VARVVRRGAAEVDFHGRILTRPGRVAQVRPRPVVLRFEFRRKRPDYPLSTDYGCFAPRSGPWRRVTGEAAS
jgi:hypothetical protein